MSERKETCRRSGDRTSSSAGAAPALGRGAAGRAAGGPRPAGPRPGEAVLGTSVGGEAVVGRLAEDHEPDSEGSTQPGAARSPRAERKHTVAVRQEKGHREELV